jgi:hypothetical protein
MRHATKANLEKAVVQQNLLPVYAANVQYLSIKLQKATLSSNIKAVDKEVARIRKQLNRISIINKSKQHEKCNGLC